MQELRTEMRALGDFQKLKVKMESIVADGLANAEAAKLLELDELVGPCLAFDFESQQDANPLV